MNTICSLLRISARRLPHVGLITVIAFAAQTARAAWGDSIAISATSAPGYIRGQDAQGKPLPETYIFMEGQFMGGNAKDLSQRTMTFADITKMLAVNLAKQSYYPTRDTAAANIIIRVYWGTTTIYEDPQKELSTDALNASLQSYTAAVQADGIADAGELNSALDRLATGQNSAAAAVERNAALLGYQRSLEEERAKPTATAREMTMSVELNEERYFVVLMAYDYQFMLREKKPKLLWVTRLSMRSPGHNFTEALPALAVAGSEVFGRSTDGLQRVKINDRQVEVRMGELKVLGTTDDKADTKGK